MEYIEKVINEMSNKTVVFWGAGRRLKNFMKEFCENKKIIPFPDYICDSTRKIDKSEFDGISILPFENLKKMDYENTVIILTAGLFDLQSQIIINELYYFPIYHCRSFEVHYFLKENKTRYETVLNMLGDENSRQTYRKLFDNIEEGSFFSQSLFQNNAYFGNDIIGKLNDNDVFAYAGAFNGKHIDRALKNNSNVKIHAFEPSKQWYNYLIDKYKQNSNVSIYNNILWDKKERLRFDVDGANLGLDAHVINGEDNKYDSLVESINLDSLKHEKLSLIALDVEGSECKALQGAAQIIKSFKPKLAVCLYHNMKDFIEIPFLIDNLSDGGYKFYVKQHSCVTAIETVLYAV